MDAVFVIFVFFLSMIFIYFLLHYKLTQSITQKFRSEYKDLIEKDIRDFYREAEAYASLMEARINTFKQLVQRFEDRLQVWQEIADIVRKTKKGRKIEEYIEKNLEKENKILEVLQELQRQKEAEKEKNQLHFHDYIDKKQQAKPQRKLNAEKVKMPNASDPQLGKQSQISSKKKPAQAKPHQPQTQRKQDVDASSVAVELVHAFQDSFEPDVKPPAKSQPEFSIRIPKENLNDTNKDPSTISLLFGKLGSAIWNFVTKDSKARARIEEIESSPSKEFASLLEKKLDSASSARPAESRTSFVKDENNKIEKSEEEFLTLAQQMELLRNPLTRSVILKQLLANGFAIEQIAQMSQVPLEELKRVANQYGQEY